MGGCSASTAGFVLEPFFFGGGGLSFTAGTRV